MPSTLHYNDKTFLRIRVTKLSSGLLQTWYLNLIYACASQNLQRLYPQSTNYHFLNWDSLHARLNNHYEAFSYKKKKHKKIKAYKKPVQKEPTVKRCLLILDLEPLRSQVKGKHSIGRDLQSLAMRGQKLLTNILVTSRIGDRKIM